MIQEVWVRVHLVSHRCRRRSRSGDLGHARLYVVLEGSDVAFFLYDDAERQSQGNVPSSLWHHDFGQVSLLLHLETCTHTQPNTHTHTHS